MCFSTAGNWGTFRTGSRTVAAIVPILPSTSRRSSRDVAGRLTMDGLTFSSPKRITAAMTVPPNWLRKASHQVTDVGNGAPVTVAGIPRLMMASGRNHDLGNRDPFDRLESFKRSRGPCHILVPPQTQTHRRRVRWLSVVPLRPISTVWHHSPDLPMTAVPCVEKFRTVHASQTKSSYSSELYGLLFGRLTCQRCPVTILKFRERARC